MDLLDDQEPIDPATPEAGAEPEPQPTPVEGAPAATPGEDDPWLPVKELEADPENALRAIEFARYQQTPEGAQAMVQEVYARTGDAYLQQRLAGLLGNHDGRRRLEHALKKFKQENGVATDPTDDGGGAPAADEAQADLRAEMRELNAKLARLEQGTTQLTSTLGRTAAIQEAAVASGLKAAQQKGFQMEVLRLMEQQPQAYAGPQGAARAIQAVQRDWTAKARAMGFGTGTGAPSPAPGGGGPAAPRPKADPKAMEELIAKAVRAKSGRDDITRKIAEQVLSGLEF